MFFSKYAKLCRRGNKEYFKTSGFWGGERKKQDAVLVSMNIFFGYIHIVGGQEAHLAHLTLNPSPEGEGLYFFGGYEYGFALIRRWGERRARQRTAPILYTNPK